ncbi:hypothetical protein GCM10009838_74810 [Catenulispora subtropica]|uniref:Uncharacterized protein n=1 Tax=Catenulispora subtropica TaxID=450798 RepID=A0ABN2T5B8_9ACTN
MPPASPVPGWCSGEVCTDKSATRLGSVSTARYLLHRGSCGKTDGKGRQRCNSGGSAAHSRPASPAGNAHRRSDHRTTLRGSAAGTAIAAETWRKKGEKKPGPARRSRGDVSGTGPGRRAGLHSHTAEGRAPPEGSKRGMSDVKAT